MKQKKLVFRYISLVTFCLVVGFCYWFFYGRFHEYTDDAYVEGNQVLITPLRPGFVKAIHTDDTFLVKRGQLLVELDETDARIEFNRAKEQLADVVREICALFHQTFAYQSDIGIKKAALIVAEQDFEHRQNVIMEGGVSLENFEHAIAALRESYYALQKAENLYEKNVALIRGTSIRNHPRVQVAIDNFLDAWVGLYRCKIYSPVEGLTAQRTIQVGKWTPMGEPLLSVIPLDQIWVNANFKETQLKKMRIGQPVKVTADLYGREVVFRGTILGLPGGAGNIFSLLPPQNLSGNWIKIVQRLPVRVGLDKESLIEHPLRLGLSMKATADLHNQEGEMVPETTAGSPTYETFIYELEEVGSKEAVEKIFEENFDSTLEAYKTVPFQVT